MSLKAITTIGRVERVTCVHSENNGRDPVFRVESDLGKWYFGGGRLFFPSAYGFALHRREDLSDEPHVYFDICLFASMCRYFDDGGGFIGGIVPGMDIPLLCSKDRAWDVVKHDALFLVADPFDHVFEDIEWYDVNGQKASEHDAENCFCELLSIVYVVASNTARRLGEKGFSYELFVDALRCIFMRWRRNHHVKINGEYKAYVTDEQRNTPVEEFVCKNADELNRQYRELSYHITDGQMTIDESSGDLRNEWQELENNTCEGHAIGNYIMTHGGCVKDARNALKKLTVVHFGGWEWKTEL